MHDINLLGLPGSGKQIVKNALINHFKAQSFKCNLLINAVNHNETINWLVIDIRSKLQHKQALQCLVNYGKNSSLVIFIFAENSELDVQSFWQKWVKTFIPHITTLRLFYNAFNNNFLASKYLLKPANNSPQLLCNKLQRLSFKVVKINLDHLLAGLDACKQNLQMDIWRVKGSVFTTEYAHPVMIEGTINRWDTFAAEQVTNKLLIKGLNLNKDFLQEIIDASQL